MNAVQIQADILDAAKESARTLLAEQRSLENCTEDGHFHPVFADALRARGFACDGPRNAPTMVRSHPFDLIWHRDGVSGAVELKLKDRQAPADDARLFYWYDLKWLESGIDAQSFGMGTAILLTELRQLYQETGHGDGRADYYRIGHTNAHRCVDTGPDHVFDLKYKPGNQFMPELYPLHIRGCYDLRNKWHHVPPLFVLAVPVGPADKSKIVAAKRAV